jgi:hypothetical protein
MIQEEQESIIRDIQTFFNEQIVDKLGVDNIVLDVTRPRKDLVKLVDLNPFGPTTDTALFEWSELADDLEPDMMDFRFVQTKGGIQPNRLVLKRLKKHQTTKGWWVGGKK